MFFLLHLFGSVYFDRGSYPTFGIRVRMPKQILSRHKVAERDMITIKSEKEGSIINQYSLLTKSNNAAWSKKMCVNLQAQGVFEIPSSTVKKLIRKDKMALVALYKAILEDVLLMLAEKGLGKGIVGDATNSAWGSRTCQGSKG